MRNPKRRMVDNVRRITSGNALRENGHTQKNTAHSHKALTFICLLFCAAGVLSLFHQAFLDAIYSFSGAFCIIIAMGFFVSDYQFFQGPQKKIIYRSGNETLYKPLANFFVGGGFACAALAMNIEEVDSVIVTLFGIIAFLFSGMAYGVARGNIPAFSQAVLAETQMSSQALLDFFNNTESYLDFLEKSATQLGNAQDTQTLQATCRVGRKIIINVEQNPANIKHIRHFLTTHLQKATQLVRNFVACQSQTTATIERDFSAALEALHTVFSDHHGAITQEGTQALRMQIEAFHTHMNRPSDS